MGKRQTRLVVASSILTKNFLPIGNKTEGGSFYGPQTTSLCVTNFRKTMKEEERGWNASKNIIDKFLTIVKIAVMKILFTT